MDLNIADVKFQGELKWKVIPELELCIRAVKYQGTSQEHSIKDDSNQAQAYRAGLDDKTIMDKNPFFIRIPTILTLCLLRCCLKEVSINVETIRC